MMNFPMRYSLKDKTYGGSLIAKDYAQAKARCKQMGWELEEDAAKRNAKIDESTPLVGLA